MKQYHQQKEQNRTHTSSFQLRLFLSALLFAVLIIMDSNHIEVAEITADKILQMISADYEEKLEVWVEMLQLSGQIGVSFS